MYGAIGCVARLLEGGALINARDRDGHTPLHLAASEGETALVEQLLSAAADATAVTQDSRARLMSGGLAIDMPGGRTPLHMAAVKGRFAVAEKLLAAWPEGGATHDFDGATPRDAALREGATINRAVLAPGRWELARLLAPDEPVPSMQELREQAAADAVRRRARCDAAEARAKAVEEAAALAAGCPFDHGYESGDAELYKLKECTLAELLDPELSTVLQIADSSARQAAFKDQCQEITPGVFAFRLFPASSMAENGSTGPTGLAQRLLRELASVEAWADQTGWRLKRPNSMNRYGLVIKDVGLASLAEAMAAAVVSPLAAILGGPQTCRPELPANAVHGKLHAFTVRYRGGEDRRLDTHVDSSEVTLNVCLGSQFTGGGVYFHSRAGDEGRIKPDPMAVPHPLDCSHCTATHPHEVGVALLHRGDHVHGAHNIETGERTNLIIWCQSS